MLTGFALCRAAMAVDGITAPEQSVLTTLAIMANDDAQCWPGINGAQGLTGKTKLSERTVQSAVKSLVAGGHLTRVERPGKGVVYTVHPRSTCTPTPADDAPPQEMRPAGDAPTPAAPAPKQPRTTKIPKKDKPSLVASAKKPTRVPSNFVPAPAAGSITAKAMNAWPPGEVDEQVEHFIDHHVAKGTTSLDWQASWRTWVKNWKSFNGRRNTGRMAGDNRPSAGFGTTVDAAFDFIADQRALGH